MDLAGEYFCEAGPRRSPECESLGLVPTPLLLEQGRWFPTSPCAGSPMQKLAQCWAGTQVCLCPGGLSAPACFSGSQGGAAPDKHPSLPQTCPGLPCDENQRSRL